MSYTQTLEIVAAELCEYSTKMIRMNYNRGLRWAAGRGNLEFADAYQYIFKKYFKDEDILFGPGTFRKPIESVFRRIP